LTHFGYLLGTIELWYDEIMENKSQENKIDWKTQFTTVTPFSKTLALVLFIMLPIIGYWLGIEYGKDSNYSEQEIVLGDELQNVISSDNYPIPANPTEPKNKAIPEPPIEEHEETLLLKFICYECEGERITAAFPSDEIALKDFIGSNETTSYNNTPYYKIMYPKSWELKHNATTSFSPELKVMDEVIITPEQKATGYEDDIQAFIQITVRDMTLIESFKKRDMTNAQPVSFGGGKGVVVDVSGNYLFLISDSKYVYEIYLHNILYGYQLPYKEALNIVSSFEIL